MSTLVWLFLLILLLLVGGNVLAGRGLMCFSREVRPVGGELSLGVAPPAILPSEGACLLIRLFHMGVSLEASLLVMRAWW